MTDRVRQSRDFAFHDEVGFVSTEKELQGLSRSAAEAAMCRRVFRMVRGVDQSDPAQVRLSVGIAVSISCANRGHRTPKVIEKLRVPAGYQRISTRGCQHREKPCLIQK